MTDFKFICKLCDHRIQTRTKYAGELIQCPVCEREIVIPQPPESPDDELPIAYPPGEAPPPKPARPKPPTVPPTGLPVPPANYAFGESPPPAPEPAPAPPPPKPEPPPPPPSGFHRPSPPPPPPPETPPAPAARPPAPAPSEPKPTSPGPTPPTPSPAGRPPAGSPRPSPGAFPGFPHPHTGPGVPATHGAPGTPKSAPPEPSPPPPEPKPPTPAPAMPSPPPPTVKESPAGSPAGTVPPGGARGPSPEPRMGPRSGGVSATPVAPGRRSPFTPPAESAAKEEAEREGPHTGILMIAVNLLVLLVVAVVLWLPEDRTTPAPVGVTPAPTPLAPPVNLPAPSEEPAPKVLTPEVVDQARLVADGWLEALCQKDLLGAARWIAPTAPVNEVTNRLAALLPAVSDKTPADWTWAQPEEAEGGRVKITARPTEPAGPEIELLLSRSIVGWRIATLAWTPAGGETATNAAVRFEFESEPTKP